MRSTAVLAISGEWRGAEDYPERWERLARGLSGDDRDATAVDTTLGSEELAGRMQYVSPLKGTCILFQYDQDAYFIRTSA